MLAHTRMEVPVRIDVVVVRIALLQAIGLGTLGHAGQDLIWHKIWFGRDSPEMLLAVFQQPRPSSKVLWR